MEFIFLFFTYFLTSIPFGYVIGLFFGKDVTKEGSGNIGATNVARTIGKKAGLFVLFLDLLKGFIPVYLAKLYGFSDKFVAVIAILAVVGHCFSVFLKFKGGKGVATGIGVLFALSPKVALIVMLFWLGVFLTTGYVSLASILSAFISWIIFMYVDGNIYYTTAAFISSVIIVFKHTSNIERFLSGTENRFIYK